MAGELGHVHIPMDGLLAPGQPVPQCNCGFAGDAESLASLTGIERNLLPYWLTQYEGHPLADVELRSAAKLVRGYGERGDPLAMKIFEQQAMAIGRLFTIVANVTDPAVYFVGGGVVEAEPHFRDWFLDTVAAAPRFGPSRPGWRRSRSYRTATWPAPEAPRSPPRPRSATADLAPPPTAGLRTGWFRGSSLRSSHLNARVSRLVAALLAQ